MKRPTSMGFLVLGFGLAATTTFYYSRSRVPSAVVDHVAVTASSASDEEDSGAAGGKSEYRENSVTLQERLAKVIVYSDRAELTRVGSVKLKPGTQWLRFDEIASGFFPSTARIVAGEEFAGKIVQIAGEEVFTKGILKAETRAKIDRLRGLYGDLLAESQRAMAIDRQISFVRELKFDAPFQRTPASAIYRPFSASVDSLRASMEEIRSKTTALTAKRDGLGTRIGELQERIALLERELENQSSGRDQDWKTTFYFLVDSKATQTASFELHYQVPNALWRPIYDIRAELNHEKGVADIKLVTAGMIEQKTGEDWKQVGITLSSLDPVSLYLPKLERRVLRENRTEAPIPIAKEKAQASKKVSAIIADEVDSLSAASPAAVAVGKAVSNEAMEMKEEKSDRRDSGLAKDEKLQKRGRMNFSGGNAPASSAPVREAEGRALASLFPLDGLETIYPKLGHYARAIGDADRERKVQSLDAKLAVATPARIDYADSGLPAVQAKGRLIEFTSPFPVDLKTDESPLKVPVHTQSLVGKLSYFAIPKNDARVYLRAKTTNTTDRPILGGGAQVFMEGDLVSKTELSTVSEESFFEVDLGVDRNVETKRIVTRSSKTTGILTSTHHTEVAVKIELANHHPYAIDMEVKDNYPRSPDKKIEATLMKVEPDVAVAEKEYGVISWKIRVPARSKKTVSFVYDVSHPDNTLVSEFN